jgi:hypothetical protein
MHRCSWGAALALMLGLGANASAQMPEMLQRMMPSSQSEETLQKVVIVSRHGVRTPIVSLTERSNWVSDPWPTWTEPDGELTARGALLAVQMGRYYRQYLNQQAATPAEMDRLQADVVDAVGNGRILVANIIGSGTDTSGYSRSFPGGHYVTIVGYSDDGRRVRVADPSGVGPASYWMTTIDMAHWIASRGYTY